MARKLKKTQAEVKLKRENQSKAQPKLRKPPQVAKDKKSAIVGCERLCGDLAGLTDSELEGLLDAAEAEAKIKKRSRRTSAQMIRELARQGITGLDDSIRALNRIFGKK